jgi:hypothetical protein
MDGNAPVRHNKSIDTDVLAAGFACLLSAGHFQRYAAVSE